MVTTNGIKQCRKSCVARGSGAHPNPWHWRYENHIYLSMHNDSEWNSSSPCSSSCETFDEGTSYSGEEEANDAMANLINHQKYKASEGTNKTYLTISFSLYVCMYVCM